MKYDTELVKTQPYCHILCSNSRHCGSYMFDCSQTGFVEFVLEVFEVEHFLEYQCHKYPQIRGWVGYHCQ